MWYGTSANQNTGTWSRDQCKKNIDQSCVFWHIFSTRNLCKDIINIRPTSKGALCLVSTLVSGWVSAFGQPYGPCPQADTQPDTRVDTRPRTPFSVGLIYLLGDWVTIGEQLESPGDWVTADLYQAYLIFHCQFKSATNASQWLIPVASRPFLIHLVGMAQHALPLVRIKYQRKWHNTIQRMSPSLKQII